LRSTNFLKYDPCTTDKMYAVLHQTCEYTASSVKALSEAGNENVDLRSSGDMPHKQRW